MKPGRKGSYRNVNYDELTFLLWVARILMRHFKTIFLRRELEKLEAASRARHA